jgi:hypothetical protein
MAVLNTEAGAQDVAGRNRADSGAGYYARLEGIHLGVDGGEPSTGGETRLSYVESAG